MRSRVPSDGYRAAPADWLVLGLVVIALGLAALALAGPLAFEIVDYRVTETLRNQTIGLDLVSLAVVAPLAIAGSCLGLRR